MDHDALIIGAGLSGLVTALHAAERGRQVALLDMEGPQSLGGQAWWSLGGLFMVDTPEKRRVGLRDSRDLAASDWFSSASFDRPEDAWPRQWAEAYLDFAAGPMRAYLHALGMPWFPVLGWAERGGALAMGHGNSIPRFHVTWGTGTGVVQPYADRVLAHPDITLHFRHRVTDLLIESGDSGDILADGDAVRGASTNRTVTGPFTLRAARVVIASGGLGGNHDRVRAAWPTVRLGPAPVKMVSGVPNYVDGQLAGVAEATGAAAIDMDRMWHYTEGLRNRDPIWPNHGIRILPGPSSMWFDATGDRMEAPCFPGFDTSTTIKRILSTGHDHSWFILTQSIIEKEFALSGCEQNPDLTSGKWSPVLRERLGKGATAAVEAFKTHGEDFVVARDPDTLVAGMNALRSARKYVGDKLIRTAKPHRMLDPAHGPLIAVRLNNLTRKSLGGLHAEFTGQCLRPDGTLLPGLFAAGEVAGFGGGGYHGHNALEGTFLGGCIFSVKTVGGASGRRYRVPKCPRGPRGLAPI